MKFTAKISFRDQSEPRFIPNCTLYKGKLVMVYKEGRGEPEIKGGITPGGDGDTWEEYPEYVDAYKPYVNKDLLEENGLTQKKTLEILEQDQMKAFEDERIFNCLFEMGWNKGGKFVENWTETKKKEEEEKLNEYSSKTKPIPFGIGIFGLTTVRLPKSIWTLIKDYGQYHSGDEEDEELADDRGYPYIEKYELKGWFYRKEAMKALLDAGYPVKYRNYDLTSLDDIKMIDQMIKEKRDQWYAAHIRYAKRRQELENTLRDLYKSGEYISKDEADRISQLPEKHFDSLDVKGSNIYGGGKWMHITPNYLYIVHNNGMDGDDWSLNNYKTGGAGAIAVRIKRDEKINKFLQECERFEQQDIKDYLKNE